MCVYSAVSSYGDRLFWLKKWEPISPKSNRDKGRGVKYPSRDRFLYNWTWLRVSNGETRNLNFITRSPKSLKSDPINWSGWAIELYGISREQLTTAHLTPENLYTNSSWTKTIPNPEHLKFLQVTYSPKKRLRWLLLISSRPVDCSPVSFVIACSVCYVDFEFPTVSLD